MRASRLLPSVTPETCVSPSTAGASHKNWCPIYGTDLFVFDVHPTLAVGTIPTLAIGTIPTQTQAKVVHRHDNAAGFATLRPPNVVHGATNYVHFPELASYVGIVHVKNVETWRYTQVWVALDASTFEMRRRSDEFRVDALLGWNEYSDVAFCMGIERCCGKLYVTFSQHDERMVLFSIDDPVEFLSGALREI